MLVSIILSTYNRGNVISRAIDSVLQQTFTDFELIIVDDGSIDRTKAVISAYAQKDSRMIILKNEKNIGQVKSLKKGISQSKGKYIARIDDDDVWCDSEKLEKQVRFLESHPEYVLIGGGIIIVNEKGKELVRYLNPKEDDKIRSRMLFSPQFVHGSVVFRKDAYEAVGGYDENLELGEDWDLWLKFGKAGKMANIPDYFLRYTRGKNRKTSHWRRETKYDNALRKKYKDAYPNYGKALMFGFLASLYYSLPFLKNIMYPMSAKLRAIFYKIAS